MFYDPVQKQASNVWASHKICALICSIESSVSFFQWFLGSQKSLPVAQEQHTGFFLLLVNLHAHVGAYLLHPFSLKLEFTDHQDCQPFKNPNFLSYRYSIEKNKISPSCKTSSHLGGGLQIKGLVKSQNLAWQLAHFLRAEHAFHMLKGTFSYFCLQL